MMHEAKGEQEDFGWLPAWLETHGLYLDVPMPEGVSGGIAGLIEHAWNTSSASWRVDHSDDSIAVRSTKLPGLPVFTVKWEQTVKATMESFMAFSLTSMAEQAAAWDSTFLGADYLAEHGDPSAVGNYARLVRWRFRAAPLKDRELLYLVLPSTRGGATKIAYVSVSGEQYPVAKGHVRARNLMPSFDLAQPTADSLRVRHCMTTHIGGWIPNMVWNSVFKGTVCAQYAAEARSVRAALADGSSTSERKLSQGD
jgi:hypothetical protein